MSDRSSLRLFVFGVLVVSLIATLLGRLFFLQVLRSETYKAASVSNITREVITPAVRGLILDQAGRPLVSNRIAIVVSVDRTVTDRLPDKGKEVIGRLATELGTTYDDIAGRLMACGAPGAPRPPVCWNGSPYQPIPVAEDVSEDLALRIMERRLLFPGVQAQLEAVREYPRPWGVNAAHTLGYLGPVTQDQLDSQDPDDPSRLRRNDLIGRAGLESSYDMDLRGVPGVKTLAVDSVGRVTGVISEQPSTPGNYVISTMDSHLQAVVEDQLLQAVDRAQRLGNPADAAAAVVMDVTNGAVLAMASYPAYDPSVWIGGISTKDYQQLVDDKALTSAAYQGSYAPGSTFKVVTTAAAGAAGYNLQADYDCPSDIKVGSQTFRNNESAAYGKISLARALEVSCNTVFYGVSLKMWEDAGGFLAGPDAPDPIAKTAREFGLGEQTGIDLPGESRGRVPGRDFKLEQWQKRKITWCANAALGYPETRKADPELADYFTQLDAENCREGYIWRQGDALNTAIGQGDTAVTPLQMAMVYSSIANGGTVWKPRMARAVVSSSGELVRQLDPTVLSRIQSPSSIAFLKAALPGVTVDGTGRDPFIGFPLDQIPVASKTGSAQVFGKEISTSWFASYAPANNPKYAVVMMVSQGGTGSGTSGPSVRKIYEALFGIEGTTITPSRSVLVGGQPLSRLPVINRDGTSQYPEMPNLPTELPGVGVIDPTVRNRSESATAPDG